MSTVADSQIDKTVIVLFGFNRPDFIRNRLEELTTLDNRNIFISIDWCDNDTTSGIETIVRNFLESTSSNSKFEYKIHKINQGLARHITMTISQLLEKFESVIVIEDDIRINRETIETFDFGLSYMNENKYIASIGGYSPIKIPGLFQWANCLRTSRYFSCWGWATNRTVWDRFSLDISNIDIAETLQDSSTFSRLNKFQKQTWLGRFKKIQSENPHTWDFQFQYMCYRNSMVNLLPLGRLTENLGFMDKRSAHTTNARPWWLPVAAPPKRSLNKIRENTSLVKCLEWVESKSTIGDNRQN